MMVVDWPVMLYISVLVAWLLVHGHALQDSYVVSGNEDSIMSRTPLL